MAKKVKCPSCGKENIAGLDSCDRCLHSLMQKDLPRPKKNDSYQSALMTAPMTELLTGKDLLVAKPNDTIDKIVEIFQKEKKSCILVYKEHHLAGIITNRDLLNKVAGKYKDLTKVTAEEVMTPKPEHVKADAPIAYVVNMMAMGGYRRVPVLRNDGSPLSVITIKDVMTFLSSKDKFK